MTNDSPTSKQRLDEIASILALGVLRLKQRKQIIKEQSLRDISLDFTLRQSIHDPCQPDRRKP